MSPTALGAVEVVRALTAATTGLSELADWLSSLDAVTTVTRVCWMTPHQPRADGATEYGHGSALTVEWFVDAELENGLAASFGLELSWESGRWTVRPGVRATRLHGQDNVLDLPVRRAVHDSEMCLELSAAVAELASVREEAMKAVSALGR